MSMRDYLESLGGKRSLIERQIDEELRRRMPDRAVLARLNEEKLRIAKEISSFPSSQSAPYGQETVEPADLLIVEESRVALSLEEALGQLDQLTDHLLHSVREGVEEARRHNREFERIMAGVRTTLDAVDERSRAPANG